MISYFRKRSALILTLAITAGLTAHSRADLIYRVRLNVASLTSDANRPFSLDFQLERGSGNVTNTVTISNFSFTGGSYDPTPNFAQGGYSGGLSSSVTLTNSSMNNEFAEAFDTSVTSISFIVDETSNSETVFSGTPIPDQFNFYLDDNNGEFIPTTDTANSTLFTEAIASTQTLASVQTFSSVSPDAGVTVDASAIPEPATAGLLALGGLALCARRRRAA